MIEPKDSADGERACPLCGSNKYSKLGIRGTREYFGADPNYVPHVVTDVMRCHACDFIFVPPLTCGLEHLEQEYYNDSDRYTATAEFDPSQMFQCRLKLISTFKMKETLLDIGAGKGEFLYEAARVGWKVQGVEPSANFRMYARKHYQIDLRAGRLEDSPEIPDDYFDVITLNHVLEHVSEPASLLNLIPKYLKRDGVLFIEVPNCDSYFLRLIDIYFRLKGLKWSSRLSPFHPPFHRYGFTQRSLEFLLRRCNYKILAIKTFSGMDRGFKASKSRWHPEAILRDVAACSLWVLGNRELLAVVAQPVR